MAQNSEKENELILDYNNNNLRFKFTLNNESIIISIKDFINAPNYYYKNFFNINELSKKYKAFRVFYSIDKVLNYFLYLIKKNQYSLIKINDNEFI